MQPDSGSFLRQSAVEGQNIRVRRANVHRKPGYGVCLIMWDYPPLRSAVPFHLECWWIYQNMAASKRRRIRYHAKRSPAEKTEDGALASEAGAAEPLVPPSIEADAVEQC